MTGGRPKPGPRVKRRGAAVARGGLSPGVAGAGPAGTPGGLGGIQLCGTRRESGCAKNAGKRHVRRMKKGGAQKKGHNAPECRECKKEDRCRAGNAEWCDGVWLRIVGFVNCGRIAGEKGRARDLTCFEMLSGLTLQRRFSRSRILCLALVRCDVLDKGRLIPQMQQERPVRDYAGPCGKGLHEASAFMGGSRTWRDGLKPHSVALPQPT